MNTAEAASHVAAHLGVSQGDVIIESIQERVIQDSPRIIERTIRYRLTKKGYKASSQLRIAEVTPRWRVPAQYIARFNATFANTQGANTVADQLTGNHYLRRIGAFHQADVADEIGPDHIRSFEESFDPIIMPTQRIDIATIDNVAIEAKALAVLKPVTKRKLHHDCKQAVRRLVGGAPNEVYDAVVVVYPLGALTNVQTEVANLEAQLPNLRICEIDKLVDVLDEL